MRYLVVSRKAGLMHVAKWLEGEAPGEVRCGSLSEHAEKFAWRGLLAKERGWNGRRMHEALEGFDGTLVTDDPRWTDAAAAKGIRCFGVLPEPDRDGATRTRVVLGGWWNGAELQAAHWLVLDWGLWPGGQGPQVVGGLSLIRPEADPPLAVLEPHRPALAGHLGYVAVDLAWDGEAGGWRGGSLRGGWCPAALALLHGCPLATGVLSGEAPVLAPFTVAVPVSSPPYPFSLPDRPAAVALPLTPDLELQLVLGDVMKAGQGTSTAGVDGAVALAIGRGKLPGTARLGAQAAARALGLPQWRADTGAGLDELLAWLESQGRY